MCLMPLADISVCQAQDAPACRRGHFVRLQPLLRQLHPRFGQDISSKADTFDARTCTLHASNLHSMGRE